MNTPTAAVTSVGHAFFAVLPALTSATSFQRDPNPCAPAWMARTNQAKSDA